MDTSLNGRVALITGGSKGLGLAMAKAYYLAGAKVAILARDAKALSNAEDEIRKLSVSDNVSANNAIASFVCDVTDPQGIIATHKEVVGSLGNIDILVNNAGQSAAKPFIQITDEEWQADLDLKLMAAVRLTRLVWPHMSEQKWGRS